MSKAFPDNDNSPAVGSLLMAAALTLPGLQAPALAQDIPESAMVGLKYLRYQDSQPGLDRISVSSPSLVFQLPIAGEWLLEGGLTTDHISGASPRYHTSISGASRMSDRRNANDISVTRYLPRASLTLGTSYSAENDYLSRGYSIQGSFWSEDKNTTWLMGLGNAEDRINPVTQVVVGEQKHTTQWLFGLTQVLTPRDIVQFSLTHAVGQGYFSDPYKTFDQRPRQRNQTALQAKWNHHMDATGGTSRLSYTWSDDSYGIRAHALSEEYVQSLPEGWSVTPSFRLYLQSAASFYLDPVYGFGGIAPIPLGFPDLPPYYSQDQRLSSFGALTFGIKLAREFGAGWSADLKVERYEQRGSWQLIGQGSSGLAPFVASWVQMGLYRRW